MIQVCDCCELEFADASEVFVVDDIVALGSGFDGGTGATGGFALPLTKCSVNQAHMHSLWQIPMHSHTPSPWEESARRADEGISGEPPQLEIQFNSLYQQTSQTECVAVPVEDW